MKRILSILLLCSGFLNVEAQENVYPAPPQKEAIALTNATIHIGNGQVIQGDIVFENGKITYVGPSSGMPAVPSKNVIDCSGKHIYPGLIQSVSNLGLVEINAVRASDDSRELGENNANVHSIVAYNADSKIIGTLRTNGIVLANVVPEGGIISGSSSVVQLDAWNWEDAAYKTDNGIHFNMPSLAPRRGFGGGFRQQGEQQDPIKAALERIEKVRSFLKEAQAYYAEPKHDKTNLRFEAVKGLFDKSKIFYVHCDLVKEMMVAGEFAKEFGFKTVIVGGTDSWKITDYIKENNMAVILGEMHSLPVMQDDDVDQPYKTPYLLQQAGVLFAISDQDAQTRGRNLMFNAGTAVAYGLTKEQALQAITLNAAKLLGIDDRTGSLEKGKDANIVISNGDILDMKSSLVSQVFIQGRTVSMDDKQKQLYERYKYKYGIK